MVKNVLPLDLLLDFKGADSSAKKWKGNHMKFCRSVDHASSKFLDRRFGAETYAQRLVYSLF